MPKKQAGKESTDREYHDEVELKNVFDYVEVVCGDLVVFVERGYGGVTAQIFQKGSEMMDADRLADMKHDFLSPKEATGG
jgi:hypothetical protein